MKAFQTLTSKLITMPQADIDTDQIIPAKFLTTTQRTGLGQHLFHHWRYDDSGRERADFPLNQPQNKTARILVAGHNFGCGSSREHAPWALLDYGIEIVISTQIADIFRGNSLKNGLLPIVVDEALHGKLLDHQGRSISVSLEYLTLSLWDGSEHHFEIDAFSRNCLLQGVDQLGYLLSQESAITAFEANRSE